MYNFIKTNPVIEAIAASAVILGLVSLSFLILEPIASRAAATTTDQFTVTQSITDELSFLTTANNVTMSPAIAGLTGGTSNGQTRVVVSTNSSTGYIMTIDFASSSYGTAAMNRNGGGGFINDYTPATPGTPDYGASLVPEVYAQLGYTINASTTADLDLTFRNNGSVCSNNTGGDVASRCWMNPSTSAETIINRSSATPASGSTTTIQFKVNVPANPTPSLQTGTYTATATLTAVII